MTTQFFRKISWQEFRKGMIGLAISFVCIMIHTLLWYLYMQTFISKVLLWVVMIVFSWATARLFKKWLTRLFENTDFLLLHMGVTLLLFSWIPFAGLVATNYLLADKDSYAVTIPVVVRDVEHNTRPDRITPYVKVQRGPYRKFFYVTPKDMPLERIDSMQFRLSRGYLGFEIIRHEEFISH